MRFIVLTALLVALIHPAFAGDNNSSPPSPLDQGRVFGSATCAQGISCDTDAFTLLPKATQCIDDYFGLNDPLGYFESESGLDTNHCLSLKHEATETNGTLKMVPHCCVVADKQKPGTCIFVCDKLSIR